MANKKGAFKIDACGDTKCLWHCSRKTVPTCCALRSSDFYECMRSNSKKHFAPLNSRKWG